MNLILNQTRSDFFIGMVNVGSPLDSIDIVMSPSLLRIYFRK